MEGYPRTIRNPPPWCVVLDTAVVVLLTGVVVDVKACIYINFNESSIIIKLCVMCACRCDGDLSSCWRLNFYLFLSNQVSGRGEGCISGFSSGRH